LSAQQIEELAVRYNAGEDTPELSRAFGISRGGLRKLLLAQGVSFRKQPMTRDDAERAIRLYQRGLTINEVVDQVGYSFSTVRRMLHANGVAVRVRGVGKREASGERA
jgi:AraC-like DNA-binding protein